MEHVLHILLPCANRLFSIPFYSSFNYFCFLGFILTASHACLHVLKILLAKLTNNLQNTKLPASYSRFSCKICRFYDEQTPNHILQGQFRFSVKRKVFHLVWFRFKFRKAYIYNKVGKLELRQNKFIFQV